MYKITEINGVKTYNMSAGKTFTQFYQQAKKTHKSLRYNEEFRKRIELIQDFQFEIATNQVEISNDQRYVIAAGIYAPQIKIFDTSELSLKCLRGIDSEVVKFKILSEDYSKIVMAQHDRSIDFHAQYGAHYKTRIPHFPRDLQYNPINANLCISASAPQIYRISLQQGKFLAPLHTNSIINSVNFNEKLNLLVCGGEADKDTGKAGVEVWDFRQRERACILQTDHRGESGVSYLKCDPSGLLLGIGGKGAVDIYDFRFDRKLYRIRSSYNEPINSIHFLDDYRKSIIVSNKKQIKITQNQGQFFTSIEPETNINMCTIVKDTGMIFAALEDPKIGCYFVPQLGPAPKWVPFIQNITEEMEQNEHKTVYDDYKFVTKQQVFELGCSNLVNTKLLKEYMHGYLMHMKLYNKVQHKLENINYAQQKQKMLKDKIENEAPKRIQEKQQEEDERFASMKNNPQFQINKFSEDYMLRHPHMKRQLMKEKAEEDLKLEKALRMQKKKMIEKKKERELEVRKKRKLREKRERDD